MMIPMKPSSMLVTMAMIFSLREGISLADFCLPESFLSLCVFRPAEAAEFIYDPPRSLRFLGRQYTRRGDARGGPGRPHHLVAQPRPGPHQGVVWAPGGSSRPLLLATSVFWPNRNFWVFSDNFWSLEILYLDSPFSSRILTPAVNSPIIIKHAKIEETT
jgi:hypothetical protein